MKSSHTAGRASLRLCLPLTLKGISDCLGAKVVAVYADEPLSAAHLTSTVAADGSRTQIAPAYWLFGRDYILDQIVVYQAGAGAWSRRYGSCRRAVRVDVVEDGYR